MTEADVLNKAADLIDERGFTKGRYVDSDGCLCTVGALRIASGADPYTWPAGSNSDYREALNAISGYLGVWSISTWNDQPERTKDEVTAALRAAAKSVTA